MLMPSSDFKPKGRACKISVFLLYNTEGAKFNNSYSKFGIQAQERQAKACPFHVILYSSAIFRISIMSPVTFLFMPITVLNLHSDNLCILLASFGLFEPISSLRSPYI